MLTTWTLAIILLADRIVKSPWWPVSHACSLKSWSSQSARPHHAYSQLLGRQECFWSLAVLYERPQLASQHQRTIWVSLPELYLLSPDYASWSFSSLIFFSSLVYVLLVSWIMIRFTMRPFLFFFSSSLLCFFVMFILPFNLSVIFVWAWPLEDNDGNNEGSLAEPNMASQVPWRLYSYVYWVLHAHNFL